MRRFSTMLALAALAALLAAAPASASRGQITRFEAPRELLDPSQRDQALAEIESLGARSLRVILYWKRVAPQPDATVKPSFDGADPGAYAWGEYDALLAAARRRGWPVLLTISGPVPRWATRGARDHVTRPNPREFGRFVEAVGRRYGGQISTWSIWNEPNHPDFLKPQWSKRKRALSPRIYRQLYQHAERGLKRSGNGRDTVLMGETAPIGTGRVVGPLTFLRGALCLSRSYRRSKRCGRLGADGYAHHAYTPREGPFHVPASSNDVTIGVLGRLTRALDRAGRARAIRRRMPIHLTEFGIQSTPDRFAGVSLARQPEYYGIAERLAWANPRVKAFSQYLLRDDEPVAGRFGAARYGGFESGLRFANGRAKPSLGAFRLTLSALRSGRRAVLWGRVRPASGPTTASIHYAPKGRRKFRRLRSVRTDRRGAFTVRVRHVPGRRWKLRWHGHAGAPIRAYRRP